MKELKDMTLRELEKQYITSDVYRELLNCDKAELVTTENLQKWAIAKIKLLKQRIKNDDHCYDLSHHELGCMGCSEGVSCDRWQIQIDWIMENFNIKESDLE